MNKKGFIFVETIVTLTVLMALMIAMYTVFVNLLHRERTVAEYDKYGDQMILYYYRRSVGDTILKQRGNNSGAGPVNTACTPTSTRRCGSYYYNATVDTVPLIDTSVANAGGYCNIIVMNCAELAKRRALFNSNDIKTVSGSPVQNNRLYGCTKMSKEFQTYQTQVEQCPEKAQYVIMGEFRTKEGNKELYSYAHLFIPNRK